MIELLTNFYYKSSDIPNDNKCIDCGKTMKKKYVGRCYNCVSIIVKKLSTACEICASLCCKKCNKTIDTQNNLCGCEKCDCYSDCDCIGCDLGCVYNMGYDNGKYMHHFHRDSLEEYMFSFHKLPSEYHEKMFKKGFDAYCYEHNVEAEDDTEEEADIITLKQGNIGG